MSIDPRGEVQAKILREQNLGVGKTGGTWLSIMANAPTNPDAKLGFKIEIVGDNLGGSCRYEDGQYWQTGVANDKGCTVRCVSHVILV